MYNYEIMLVVNGELTQEESNENIRTLIEPITVFENFKVENIWSDTLAYPIKKKTKGHRYIFTFKTNQYSILDELKRKSLYNKNVLRILIINLEKDYGYKATKNPKKVRVFEFKLNKYKQYIAAKEEANKLSLENAVISEAGMRKVRTYNEETTTPKKTTNLTKDNNVT